MFPKKKYRSRLSIIFDILKAIHDLEEATITEIIVHANIPHNRLKNLLRILNDKGYIKVSVDSDRITYSLTPKGYKLMVELQKIRRLLVDLGLEA